MALPTQAKATRSKSFWGDIKTTTNTTVYTCPQNCTAEISFLHIVNAGGNNTASIYWYIAADSYQSNFIGGKNMATGEYLSFPQITLYLAAGDQIRVMTTSAGHVDIIGSVTETFKPIG